ncbi:GNAT family N-acetyltransferase [Mycoplasmatota bacterium WC44]
MKYIVDRENKYTKDIFDHLLKYNMSKTGDRYYYGKSHYLVENDKLLAGANTFLSWDWVYIGEIYYEDKGQLVKLISNVFNTYLGRTVGLKFESNFVSVVYDLIDIGFTLVGSVKFSPSMSNYFYLELREPLSTQDDIELIVTDEKKTEYDKLLLKEHNKLREKYKVKDCNEELCVSLYDDEIFVGGVLGVIYDDHAYVDMLVVNETYRGKGYGSKIMERFHKELTDNIVTLSLGTTQFQAKEFYEKLGYETVVVHKDRPKGFDSYTMIRDK